MNGALLQIATLWWREVTRFRRQRSRVIGAFLQPLVFWLLLGGGLSASFRPPDAPAGTNYVEYFYPGVIVLVLLFTAIFATISTVEDRKQGFLQGVLVAPITRPTIVMGQALGGTTLALIQGVIFLILAPLAGIHLTIGAVAAAIVIMALVAFALTSIGLVIAWRIDSTQGFHAIMNLILIPIWLLSGAFFPAAGAPAWLRWTMRLNPLSYGMAALRRSLYLGATTAASSAPGCMMPLAITGAYSAATFILAASVATRAAAT
jgi:ABC-2 type transport system permease protein